MDFKDQIKNLSSRIDKLKEQVTTEEATKNAFIMPFIKEMGYDVFNPFEVVPEYTADIGIKQGEKIDYAIIQNGEPIILIECKWHGVHLDVDKESQLFRYFHTTPARFAILTNGIEYRFYTDLAEPNKMDNVPFMIVNLLKLKDEQIEELKKFHKSYFDTDSIILAASDLKYMNSLRSLIINEINSPSADFVKHFAKQIYPSIVTQKIIEQFTGLIKKSFTQYHNELITDRLQSALNNANAKEETNESTPVVDQEIKANNSGIITTQDEIDAYNVIKAILCNEIDVNRICLDDKQTYCAITLDNSIKNTICRLYFSDRKRSVSILQKNREYLKHEIDGINMIYSLSAKIKEAVDLIINKSFEKDATQTQPNNETI